MLMVLFIPHGACLLRRPSLSAAGFAKPQLSQTCPFQFSTLLKRSGSFTRLRLRVLDIEHFETKQLQQNMYQMACMERLQLPKSIIHLTQALWLTLVLFTARELPLPQVQCVIALQEIAFTHAPASLLRRAVVNHRKKLFAEKDFTIVLLKLSMTSPSPRKSKLGVRPRPFRSCALTAVQLPRLQAAASFTKQCDHGRLISLKSIGDEDGRFYLVAGMINKFHTPTAKQNVSGD